MRVGRRILDRISVVVVCFGLAAAAFQLAPPFRAGLLFAIGRGSYCSFQGAVGASAMINGHVAEMDRIRASSRLAESDARGFELWETPDGRYWTPKHGESLLPSILAEKRHAIYGSGERGVKAGDIVLDCAAHVGTFARGALAAGAGKVVAIEPAPMNLECLRRNLAAEIAAGRVVVYEKGVWNKDDELSFHVDDHNSAGDAVAPGGRGKCGSA